MKVLKYELNNTPYVDNLKELVNLRTTMPNKIAFKYKKKKEIVEVTAEQLKEEIECLGTYLYNCGIKESKVALIGENSYAWILSYFSVVNGGNVIVPIDKELSEQDITEIIKRSGATSLIYADTYSDIAEKHRNLKLFNMKCFDVYITEGRKLIDNGNRDYIDYEIDNKKLCSIIYTSGTTGKPKGVMLNHKNFAADIISSCENVYIADSSMLTLPLHHTFAFSTSVLATLLKGVTISINSSLRNFKQDLKDFKPQNMFLVPLYVETMYKNIWTSEGIYFSLQNVFDNQTLEKLCEYIERNDKQTVTYSDTDFSKINELLSGNRVEKIYLPQKTEIGNLLLAGATGFLGMHILSDFLDNDTGIAYCLVRGIDTKSAEERFYELLRFYFGEKYDNCNRIAVICADLHKEKFNLSDNEYDELLSSVNTVINAAASVKHYGSYEYFYEANVETVNQLIDFCKKADAKLIHTSTLSVSGNSFEEYAGEEEVRFGEDCLYIGQPLDNVYARSKFEAEKSVLEAMSDGLKANIMRMGFLANRNSDGVFQKNYESNAFLKRIKSIIKLGVISKSFENMPIEFTPIDLAASAVMNITRNFSVEFNTFHICNIKTIPMIKLISYLQKLEIQINVIEDADFYELLKLVEENSEESDILNAFINDFKDNNKLDYSSKIKLDSDFTVEYLKKLGFEWSDIDLEYMRKYTEYFRGIGYLEV